MNCKEVKAIAAIHTESTLEAFKEQYRSYKGLPYKGMEEYYDGHYRGWRVVELMLKGSTFMDACDKASEEIKRARADIDAEFAAIEGRE